MNTEHDSLQTNERVQECLQNAKLARKQIVRYIQVSDTDHHSPVNPPFNYLLAQLVENEDMIGTLIDTNDRIIASIEMYDAVSIRLAIFTQESFFTLCFPGFSSCRSPKLRNKIFRTYRKAWQLLIYKIRS